ncbi:MAG: membrane-associated phospholipid phosphatase [Sulfurimonas sp.]|jgi:membrane-associated phospholipid phosphatase
MSIPAWGKYSINTISYLSASGSALSRVQEGGHSFSDQLVNASIGNFIGVFFSEAFLSKNETEKIVEVTAYKGSFNLKTSWSF